MAIGLEGTQPESQSIINDISDHHESHLSLGPTEIFDDGVKRILKFMMHDDLQ